jgi:hypothetical protein
MSWTLENIRSLVRTLTGRPSVNQVSNDALDAYINSYYQTVFPLAVKAPELRGFYTLALADGTGEYTLASTILTLEKPFTILDSAGTTKLGELEFYVDEEREQFFEDWPDDANRSEAIPEAVLLFGNTLYFRAVPDAVYYFKSAKVIKPTALVAGAAPLVDEWGNAIAYGSAIQYLSDAGDKEKADSHVSMYTDQLAILNRRSLRQSVAGRYPEPSF